jgi:hypothetical protein
MLRVELTTDPDLTDRVRSLQDPSHAYSSAGMVMTFSTTGNVSGRSRGPISSVMRLQGPVSHTNRPAAFHMNDHRPHRLRPRCSQGILIDLPLLLHRRSPTPSPYPYPHEPRQAEVAVRATSTGADVPHKGSPSGAKGDLVHASGIQPP